MSTVVHEHLNCPTCQYDLFGLTVPRCPECGRPFTLAEFRKPRSPDWWYEDVAPFTRPIGTGVLVFFTAINVLWVVEARHGSQVISVLEPFMAPLPWVMLCAMGQSLFGSSSFRRVLAFVYLLSVCAALLFVHLDCYRDDVNAMGRWFLVALHTDVWVVLGILFAKASIIWHKREDYSSAWLQSYVFIVCLVIITLGATVVFQAYACNEANRSGMAGLDVVTQHASAAMSAALVDLVLGMVFVLLAPFTAYLLGVPLMKQIDFSLLPKGRREEMNEDEPCRVRLDAPSSNDGRSGRCVKTHPTDVTRSDQLG